MDKYKDVATYYTFTINGYTIFVILLLFVILLYFGFIGKARLQASNTLERKLKQLENIELRKNDILADYTKKVQEFKDLKLELTVSQRNITNLNHAIKELKAQTNEKRLRAIIKDLHKIIKSFGLLDEELQSVYFAHNFDIEELL